MAIVLSNKFKKLERNGWLGHKFGRGDQVVHELRCWICGKWFNYSTKDIDAIVAQNRWDFRKSRPKHCGNSHCEEWNRRHELYQVKIQHEQEDYYRGLFLKLKKKGLVS